MFPFVHCRRVPEAEMLGRDRPTLVCSAITAMSGFSRD
jgi:hypothetical protein